ncbi:hypothetical protein J4410_03965 [Candidatus Woesearchaeota archaeon]|nr:hypothetical protein [Candidatus Woesearchaeota archaeon]
MDMVEEAYKGLYPEKEFTFVANVNYSGHFKGYNANVSLRSQHLTFKLSKQWRGVSKDIKIGLLQELLSKLFKNKTIKTYNMEVYHNFLKHVHIAVPKDKVDTVLLAHFNSVNEKYLGNMLDKPNLVWGSYSTRKLGSYDYGSDMITISKALQSDEELLEYVLYHEMLHKKHKFSHKAGRSHSHTFAFREDEARFENAENCERRLKYLPRKPQEQKRASRGLFRFFRR